jgi:hypothetical protein
VAALGRLDSPNRPIAETHRRLGVVADQLGLPRPSYQQVRVILHGLRAVQRDSRIGEVLLEIAFRSVPPEALLDELTN